MAVLRSVFSAVTALLLLAGPSEAWLGCLNGWCFWGFHCKLHPNVIGQQCQKLCIPTWMRPNCPNGGREIEDGARAELAEPSRVMQASDAAEQCMQKLAGVDADTAREIENTIGSRNVGVAAAKGVDVGSWALLASCGAAVVIAAVATVHYAKKKAYVEAGVSAPLVL